MPESRRVGKKYLGQGGEKAIKAISTSLTNNLIYISIEDERILPLWKREIKGDLPRIYV